MSLQAKADALGHLVSWRKSGSTLCNNSSRIDDEILALAKHIRESPLDDISKLESENRLLPKDMTDKEREEWLQKMVVRK